jgi:hypothetical protein
MPLQQLFVGAESEEFFGTSNDTYGDWQRESQGGAEACSKNGLPNHGERTQRLVVEAWLKPDMTRFPFLSHVLRSSA